jgi:hypothetical protein
VAGKHTSTLQTTNTTNTLQLMVDISSKLDTSLDEHLKSSHKGKGGGGRGPRFPLPTHESHRRVQHNGQITFAVEDRPDII